MWKTLFENRLLIIINPQRLLPFVFLSFFPSFLLCVLASLREILFYQLWQTAIKRALLCSIWQSAITGFAPEFKFQPKTNYR